VELEIETVRQGRGLTLLSGPKGLGFAGQGAEGTLIGCSGKSRP
jgi:hypothetical protein